MLGMIAPQPHLPDRSSTTSAASASPGSAPATAIGPASGWTGPQSTAAVALRLPIFEDGADSDLLDS
jgi:hypothetical protein